jgi:ankyrin repeat protein
VNKSNKRGITPLIFANHNGHREVVQALVRARADVTFSFPF